MSDPYKEYTKAVARYAVAFARLKEAKRTLAAAKAKPPRRTYTLAEIDAMYPLVARTFQLPSFTPPHDE